MSKIVLGLSGGVDSAVCARLLQRAGHEVLGLYLDIGDESARADAVSAAGFLNMELKILDVSEALERNVCAPFTAAYLRGELDDSTRIDSPYIAMETALLSDAIFISQAQHRSVTGEEVRAMSQSVALHRQETPWGVIEYDF